VEEEAEGQAFGDGGGVQDRWGFWRSVLSEESKRDEQEMREDTRARKRG
jgi:hypothetical protein